MPQSNINALIALAFFAVALLVAKLAVKIQKGELPGGSLMVLYLRAFLGFLLAGAIILGFRSFMPQ